MKTMSVPTKPYDEERIYLRKNVIFYPGVTILVGCNGSGKSTLMMLLKDQLKQDKDILVLSYDDRMDGQSNLMSKFAFYQDFEAFGGMWSSSEGEKIFRGVSDFATGLHKKIHQKDYQEVWIFMDAVGSGLSVDGIAEIKDFAQFVIDQNFGMGIYFVISTNEYEFASGMDCIDVTTFRHVRFDSYQKYRKFILQTRKKKDRRRAKLRERA